jgi:pseudaminic acid cytidylyltransferase
MNVAVIPARGGSRRIPRKNILEFCGKPIIAWSITAALESGCFAHVIVSTDDPEVARIAVDWGADVPFVRPKELADDLTGTLPVIRHAISQIIPRYGPPESVCCVYPTAPFIRPDDLRHGLDVLTETQADFAFSVTSFAYPIQRALRITREGRVAMFFPENAEVRSQDLEIAYHDAGQFYWGRTNAFMGSSPIFSERSVPVILPRSRVQDIDTPEDWDTAVRLFRVQDDR